MSERLVAVLDVGKTNAKLVVADPSTGAELWSATRANVSIEAPPYRALDAKGIETFLIDALARCPHRDTIDTLVPVAHGAAVALVAGDDLALPVLDYEETALEDVADAYDAERPPFSETLSPRLPNGLNLGRQLFFLETRFPRDFARVDAILPWPQYFAWRLSGSLASEVTSLGAHTDLWQPAAGRFSSLAVRRGWADRFPSLRAASDSLGAVRSAVAHATGLRANTRVLAGIHDSNASFLRHRAARPKDEPFVVLSSGTWTIILAAGAELAGLDERRDCLANVDAFGKPTATARFMGGREFAAIAKRPDAPPTAASLRSVLRRGAMALPCFADGGGPFPGARGRILAEGLLAPDEETALATLYLALVAETSLDLLSARGPIAIEGPLAKNPLFGSLLAALRPAQPVGLSTDHAGTVGGALLLARPRHVRAPRLTPAEPFEDDRLHAYRDLWRERAASG
jgi:sugar (pentulose or hexulose) kinase